MTFHRSSFCKPFI